MLKRLTSLIKFRVCNVACRANASVVDSCLRTSHEQYEAGIDWRSTVFRFERDSGITETFPFPFPAHNRHIKVQQNRITDAFTSQRMFGSMKPGEIETCQWWPDAPRLCDWQYSSYLITQLSISTQKMKIPSYHTAPWQYPTAFRTYHND
jgi:hypothetical protein